MNTRYYTALLSLALVVLVSAPNALRADDGGGARFRDARLSGGFMPTWVHSDSLGPFSETEWMLMTRVGFEWEVGHGILIGIGYAGGFQESDVFAGDFDTRLDIHELPVTLRYRHRVSEWFEPYVRVEVGPTFAKASVKQNGWSGDRLRQQGYGFRGSAGLGVEFLLPRWIFHKRGRYDGNGGFSIGFALEAGYAYRLPVAFDEMKQKTPKGNKDSNKQLPQGSMNLGTLDASGVYYSLDVVLHF